MAIDTNLNKLVINKLTKAQYQEAKQSNSIVETEIYMITDKEDIDADTLGGRAASEFATQSFVTNKIAEASLSGSDVDLSGYVSKDGSTTMTGNLQMGWKKVVNLGTPTADTDAVTKGYVDDKIDIARITATNENLNNYMSQGTYYFVDGSTPVNAPENNNNGYLVVLPSLNYIKQLWFRAGTIDATSSQTFVRTAQKDDDRFYWSAWEKFVTDAEVIPVAQGGTGATDAATARTKLGITPENIGAAPASHNQSAATITSGTLGSARLPTIPVTKGGTGATDAITAAANLGLITGLNLTDTDYEIPNNANLNDYTTTGAYRIGSASVAASLSNIPYTSTGGRLIVMYTSHGAGTLQILVFNAQNRIYFRTRTSADTWSSWYKQLAYPLHSEDYGDTLPAAGTKGRIFFKKA